MSELPWRWLLEIRRHLLRSFMVFAMVALALFPFSTAIYTVFAKPLLQALPLHCQLIALNLLNGFWVPIELCLTLAFLLTLPWWLLESWWWIKPGLYRHERRWLKHSLWLAWSLFWIGVLFAYGIVLPLMIQFLIHATPAAVMMMPDIALYTSFALRLLLSFGFAFELPLVMMIVVHYQCLSITRLKSWRRYAIVATFVVGMILAPDPVSQCLMALPLYGLYELGLCIAKPKLKLDH